MVKLTGLEKRWPSLTIRADLVVETGRFLTLLGPSGCGKSTILKLIAGFEKPDSGSVLVDGRDVTRLPPRDRGVGMVFQDYALFPHLRVEDNVAYGLAVHGMPRRDRRERARALLKSVGLEGFAKRWPDSLSGGERQRVALARTLAVEPSVILFDEPLSSLDAPLRRRLREELREQQRLLGFTAILVTHDLEEAMAVSDAIAVMDSGRVHPPLPPGELWDSPPTASTARFLGHGTVLEITRCSTTPEGLELITSAGAFRVSGCAQAAGSLASPQDKPSKLSLFLPEDAFTPLPESAQAKDALDAVCLSAVFSGRGWACRFEANGCVLSVALPRDAAPEVGKTLRLAVEPNRARVVRNA